MLQCHSHIGICDNTECKEVRTCIMITERRAHHVRVTLKIERTSKGAHPPLMSKEVVSSSTEGAELLQPTLL